MLKIISMLFIFALPSFGYAFDYSDCKSFCADKFRECIKSHKDISPEACASISNDCLSTCKLKFNKSSITPFIEPSKDSLLASADCQSINQLLQFSSKN